MTTSRLITKTFPAKVERAIIEFQRRFVEGLQPMREDLTRILRNQAVDLSSLESIRVQIEPIIRNYTGDLQVVYREGMREGARIGREIAATRHGLDIAYDRVPARTLSRLDDLSDNIVDQNIMETLTDQTTRHIRQGHEEGLGIDQIAENLNDDLFDGELEDYVAERNARTATISSSNDGSRTAYEDADRVVGIEWIAELDDRVRESHEEAHGQIIPAESGYTFLVDEEALRHPADFDGSAGNIINCRCTTAPVFEEDLEDHEVEALRGGERIYKTDPLEMRKRHEIRA